MIQLFDTKQNAFTFHNRFVILKTEVKNPFNMGILLSLSILFSGYFL